MNKEQTDLSRLLEHLSQPAFLETDGVVCFRNRLAAELYVSPGDETARYLPQTFPAGTDAPVQCTLHLPASRVSATVLPCAGGRLFLVVPPERTTLKPQALWSISHGIRTPLANLMAVATTYFPGLLQNEDPVMTQNLSSMNRAYYQLLRLACNLNDMRCILLDELRLSREKNELTSFFAKIIDRAAPLIRDAGLEFEYICNAEPFCGWIDRARLERAVWNLLSNAMNFTPRGGKITVELEYTEAFALFRVRDTGDGMTPELLSTAFCAYDRERALGDSRWGAGLGLPLSERIAQLHGGAIVLESAPGEGTCATLSLSLAVPRAEELSFHSSITDRDYAGGFPHALVELSGRLPIHDFDPSGLA